MGGWLQNNIVNPLKSAKFASTSIGNMRRLRYSWKHMGNTNVLLAKSGETHLYKTNALLFFG